jgi:hypothetical protein
MGAGPEASIEALRAAWHGARDLEKHGGAWGLSEQRPGLSLQGLCLDNFTRENRARICLDFFASDFVWTADFTI